MSVSNKKKKAIGQLSFIVEILRQVDPDWIRPDFMLDGPPESWTDNELKTFDMLNELEMKIKNAALDILA